jgi:hypothetical protein
MNAIRKPTLVLAVAVVAMLALAGAALAAGPRGGQQAGQQGYGVMAGGVVMDAAAAYIGVTETALATERHDGKSLAQIATEHGKTSAGLQAALVTGFKANLDKAVAAGRLTAAQAAQGLAAFKANVSTLVDRTATGPMNGRGHGGGMGLGLGPCGAGR